MADKILNSIVWPDMPNDKYYIPYDKIWNILPSKSLPSAPIHAFADGADNIPVKAMSVSVRAVQDLHGQTSPYPAGGGKNKLPLVLADIKSANNSGTWSGNVYTFNDVTFTVLTDAAGNVTGIRANGTASANTTLNLASVTVAENAILTGSVGGSASSYLLYATDGVNTYYQANDPRSLSAGTYAIKLQVYANYSASNVSFYPMVRLASVADATFAPYSNICPISGWTQAQIVGSGVNVWDEEWELGTYDANGAPYPNPNGIRSKNTNYIPVPHGETLYVVKPATNMYVFFYDENKQFISASASGYYNLIASAHELPIPSNVYYVRFAMANGYGTTYGHDLSINFPSSETQYRPYHGRIVTISFNGTVYGGQLRYVGGKEWEFTPTHKYITPTTGSILSSPTASNCLFVAADAKAQDNDSASETLMSTYLPTTSANVNYGQEVNSVAQNTNGRIVIKIVGCSTLSDYETYLTNNPLGIRYELATHPDPILLTADKETVTQYADNVLYADCGDSTLTYRQDIGLVIGGE